MLAPSNFEIRENHGLILLSGFYSKENSPKKVQSALRYGFAKSEILHVMCDVYWGCAPQIDKLSEKDFEILDRKVLEGTCFSLTIKGAVSPISLFEHCFYSFYNQSESSSTYYFFGHGEKVLETFFFG